MPEARDAVPPEEVKWTLVAAVAQNGVIGCQSTLPWRLRSDLKRFKKMTLGHCLLMGRKTYASIGRPLPGRQTLVLSRSTYQDLHPSVQIVSDLSEVDACVEPGRNVMVVGGADVYRAALPRCSTMWLTRLLADVDGDVFFPDVDWNHWVLRSNTPVEPDPQDQWPTEFQVWTR